jgi:protocatechuate 3,4-dioxygenase beta subunit
MNAMLGARVLLAFLLCAGTVLAQEAPQPPAQKGTASIAGRVTAADTGRPVRGAIVQALSWDGDRLVKTAGTDASGRFEFQGLASGRYEMSVSAAGYLPYQLGYMGAGALPPIDLEDGSRFEKADVVMYRPGAIEGRVLDEFGDPAPNVLVQVAQLQFLAGRKRLLPEGSGGSRPTDDRGYFRVPGLSPGVYYITALSGVFGRNPSSPMADTAPPGFAHTYYPGTVDVGNAQPVTVKRAETVANAGFSLVPAPSVNVTGTVVDASGVAVPGANLMVSGRDALGSIAFMATRALAGKDGRFTLRGVPPGSYTIQAWGRPIGQGGNLNSAEFGSLPLTVTSTDVVGLVVRTSRNAAARGRVVFEDGPVPPIPFRQVRVAGRPVEFDSAPMGGGPNPNTMNDAGAFEILNLAGRWVIRADVVSPDWSLKRVTVDGKDVTDTPTEFKDKDVEGIEVVLTARNASVAGAVLDERGRAIGNYSVVVFSVDPKRWTFPSRFVALGRPNQQGRFKVTGLPPEDYLVVAVPPLAGTEWQDPEFLEGLRNVAQPITVVEGDSKTIDLRIKK